MKSNPLFFDIKKYSINDGPGIRVTVFFKGCGLHCNWCHNPESQSRNMEKMYNANKCIGCFSCIEVCPNEALTVTIDNGIVTDNISCKLCGDCVDVCPTQAMEMSGRNYTVEELLKIIKRESPTIDTSGGGVTFSGGDPMQFPETLMELLEACGKEGLHRAVDTAGYVATEKLLEVSKETDLFLYDLKHMDAEKHKKYTGVSNELILKNLMILSETGKDIYIRIPLIENVNTDEENMLETARFIKTLPKVNRVQLLPYHNIAQKKYQKLGKNYNEGNMQEPSKVRLEEILKIFTDYGIHAEIGG